jgi:hypothetical protein
MPMMTSSPLPAKPVTINQCTVPSTVGGYSVPTLGNAEESKIKPKRRRKPQKPGLTAKVGENRQ